MSIHEARGRIINCVTCRQRYTRAYLHHLLRSKEMLAEILLYHHNHHQLQLLFHTARNHRSNQSFDDWVGHAFHWLKNSRITLKVDGFDVGTINREASAVGCTVGSNALGNDVGQTLRSLDGRLDGLTIGRLVGQI